MSDKQRVIAYIDGFNLYFGLKQKGWKSYYWLDVCKLSRSLLRDHQELVDVKYFTSRIAGPPDKRKRQGLFIEAIGEATSAKLYFGQYMNVKRQCMLCRGFDEVPTEKMTDVNIATQMLCDALTDRCDAILLVSADSDLDGPLRAIRQLRPEIRLIVAFPPERSSITLRNSATATLHIHKDNLKNSLLPPEIEKPDGFIIRRPDRWK